MWGGDDGFWRYVYGCLTCVCFERLCIVCCSFCRPARAGELPARVAPPLPQQQQGEERQPLVGRSVAVAPLVTDLPMIGLSTAGCQVYPAR